jgi:NifB/MoaA-like Fe-S oxidoreductase
MSPGVNDGKVLEQTLADLYAFGEAVGGCSVVPVGLTEFSKHHLVREPTADECRAAIGLIDARAAIALRERGTPWAFGADELYNRAGVELPPESAYGAFDQVENGVGSVRYLQRRVREDAGDLQGWHGRRIGVVTGSAMASLMPMVIDALVRETGARFEMIPVENTLFGRSVTCAGLLPGAAIRDALLHRSALDLALIPGEALNDEALFMDSMSFASLASAVPMEVRPSKHFSDALQIPIAA